MRLALLLLAAACDPVYSLHLHARVTRGGAPLPGAWVLGLDTDRPYPPSTARTGADGVAELRLGMLNRNPAGDPVAVAARSDELFVAVPGRDFEPRKRLFAREWDAALEVSLPGPRPELVLRCDGSRCAASGAPPASCSWYELAVDGAHAEGHRIDASPGATSVEFTRRGGPQIAVVAVCLEGTALRALTSNPSG